MEETGEAIGDIPDYAPCPCCVLEVYDRPYAVDEDGQQYCESPFVLVGKKHVAYFFLV